MIFDVALVNRKPECKHVPARDFEKHTLQCIFVHCFFLTELLNYYTVFAICRHFARILNLRVILYISRIQNFVWPEELQTFQLLVTGKYLHVSILGTCTALLCEIPVVDDFLQSLGPGGPWVFRPPNQFLSGHLPFNLWES